MRLQPLFRRPHSRTVLRPKFIFALSRRAPPRIVVRFDMQSVSQRILADDDANSASPPPAKVIFEVKARGRLGLPARSQAFSMLTIGMRSNGGVDDHHFSAGTARPNRRTLGAPFAPCRPTVAQMAQGRMSALRRHERFGAAGAIGQ